MKAVIITYNEAMEEEVMEILEAHGVKQYTQWTKVLGKGQGSGPHLMTPVWPKANNALLCVVEQATASILLEEVRRLRSEYHSEGVKAFQIPVEDVT